MKLVPIAAGFFAALLVVIYAADTGRLGPLGVVYSFQYGDKVGHFVLLGSLALLVDLALLQLLPRIDAKTLAVASSAAIGGFISLEELSQVWMPTRSPDVFDLLASYAGIAAGTLTAFALQERVRAPKRAPGNTA